MAGADRLDRDLADLADCDLIIESVVEDLDVKLALFTELDGIAKADAIIATAKARGCDLIAMASHGRRGLGRLVLGSVTAEVLAHSETPVLVGR